MDEPTTGAWRTLREDRPTVLTVRRFRLEVLSGPDAGLTREFEVGPVRIGSGAGCDLTLTDRKVSRIHVELTLEDEGYRLRDLASTNGTVLAGHRVRDVYLDRRAVLRLGDTDLRFEPLNSFAEVALSKAERFGGLVAASTVMRQLFARLERMAATDATVLIAGETGTGKDVAAESIHNTSDRASGPLVVFDCAAVASNLLESELFGYERGAFTGATTSHAGALERAHGGTLFLDEIGEIPLDLQPKLLRALEKREVRRVGGSTTKQVDVRIIAATNRDLAVEVNRGRFREDLYYRLAVVQVRMPALRERLEDLPLLVDSILDGMPSPRPPTPSAETIERLKRHDWPGNVRELRNVLERAVVLSQGDTGSILPMPLNSAGVPAGAPAKPADVDPSVPFKHAKQQLIDSFEREYITKLLAKHEGNISAAARAAGVDRMSIHKLLNRLGMSQHRALKKED